MKEVVWKAGRRLGADQGGILVVDKPGGWTSHDVVAKVRRLLGIRKVGHVGTLDPEATGLLPVCVGSATRIVEYLMELPKSYRVECILGEETDTHDATGRVVARHDPSRLSGDQIRTVIMRFRGTIEQVPPMYSAVRKNGRRLYELARRGERVPRDPRTVTLYEICEVVCSIPRISFVVRCSKGTYVRALCRDIGRELGVGAHMSRLRRIESASFVEKDAYSLDRIMEMDKEEIFSLLVPMDRALAAFQPVVVRQPGLRKVCQGQPLVEEDFSEKPVFGSWKENRMFTVYGEDGAFLAVAKAGRSASTQPALFPKKVFCTDRIK